VSRSEHYRLSVINVSAETLEAEYAAAAQRAGARFTQR
jgi:hypothetical protein